MRRGTGNGERMAIGLALLAGLALPASAQSVEQRASTVREGTVRMSFSARAGLCGNGENWSYRSRGNRDWESDCEPGPVRVRITMENGNVTNVRSYVGGRWRGDARLDLGTVSGAEATAFLMTVVHDGPDRAARRAMTAISLAADVTFWPEFLEVARDGDRSERVRKHALTTVSMEAFRRLDDGDAATDDDPSREMREQAVFALSQRPRDEAVPRLVELARSHRLSYVRRRALFWLGQTGDPRAIPVVEEVLRAVGR